MTSHRGHGELQQGEKHIELEVELEHFLVVRDALINGATFHLVSADGRESLRLVLLKPVGFLSLGPVN